MSASCISRAKYPRLSGSLLSLACAALVGACTTDLRDDFGGDDPVMTGDDSDDPPDAAVPDDDDDADDDNAGGAGPETPSPFNLVSAVPENGSTDAPVLTDIQLESDAEFTAGAGNVRIRRAADDSLFASIPMDGDPQVTLEGTTLTIAPFAALAGDTQYYVEFEAGALVSNGEPLGAFGGVDFYSFTTASAETPGSVSEGLVGWFDAAYAGTMILADNEVVVWSDRSGRGLNMRAQSSEARPTYVLDGLNALPTVDFDGADGLVGKGILPGADDSVTVFAVWQSDVSAAQLVFDQDSNSPAAGSKAALLANADGTYGFSGGGGVEFQNAHSYAVGQPQVSIVRLTGTNEISIIHNGLIETSNITVNSLNIADDGVAFGQGYAAQDSPLDGYLAELIFYDRQLSFHEEQSVQKYLADKWGVPLSGPQLVSTSPATAAGDVVQHTDVVLAFDRAVSPGTGEFRVLRRDDDTVVERYAADAEQLTYADSTVTLELDGLLAGASEFYVTVDSTAVLDADMAPFIGFKDNASLWFTTADVVPGALEQDVILWLDASYAPSLETEADKLVRWLDRSGKNHHAVQTNVNLQPSLVAGAVGSLGVVRFGEMADTWLRSSLSFDPSDGFELHAVVKIEDTASGQDTVVHVSQGTGPELPVFYRDATQRQDFCAFTGAQILCAPIAIRYDYQLLAIDYDGSTARLYVDALEEESVVVDLPVNKGSWVIGSMIGSGYLRGDIAELVVLDRDISADEVSPLERSLTDTWGVPNRSPNN